MRLEPEIYVNNKEDFEKAKLLAVKLVDIMYEEYANDLALCLQAADFILTGLHVEAKRIEEEKKDAGQ